MLPQCQPGIIHKTIPHLLSSLLFIIFIAVRILLSSKYVFVSALRPTPGLAPFPQAFCCAHLSKKAAAFMKLMVTLIKEKNTNNTTMQSNAPTKLGKKLRLKRRSFHNFYIFCTIMRLCCNMQKYKMHLAEYATRNVFKGAIWNPRRTDMPLSP